jgi:hypothetical protein
MVPAQTVDPRVDALIARYAPASVDAPVATFARTVTNAAAPGTCARAKALLFATARIGAFCVSVGLELSPAVVLHPSVIERFIVVDGARLTPATRRTLRTNLRFAAARVVPGLGPSPVPLSREQAKAPYTPAEIDGYFALARAQPTVARRARTEGLLCLGAGAGLMGADLRGVRGGDVVARSGGLVVCVRGRRTRVVPVLARYHDPLVASAAFASNGYVIGGRQPDRRTVTTPLVSSLAGGRDLPRLDTGRLRSTWLCAHAEALGIRAFMEAAGITCSQRLGDLIATVPGIDEARTVALLSGSC